ncbi:MAG: molybdopterin-dependent oxidoreductase [Deltaproteobacteria bacterium]|nr:molybdopterin-dependent oxidoreductase [Deltaproteobacteria bacterium]
MEEYSVIGKRLPLKDAADKVTGRATFARDFKLPGMLYAKLLRSPYPHAKVLNVDTSEAEKLPGVKAVLCKNNSPRTKVPIVFNEDIPRDRVLFGEKVRYAGEELAAVAAVSEKVAEEALNLIKVEYEELPPVFDAEKAMEPGAPLIHDDKESNVASPLIIKPGDVEKGFKEADHIFEDSFRTQAQRQAPLETHCCVASYDLGGKLTVWASTQTPHALQELLSEYLELPLSKVRVVKPYVGGGFGGKLDMIIEHIASLLSRIAGRPVKLTLNREEEFSTTVTRHADILDVKMGVKNDGTLTAMKVRLLSPEGGYFYHKSVLAVTARTFLGYYKCPNMTFEGYAVYTNHTIAGPMRGFGHPQSLFALETMLDRIAEKLDMDPVELRLKNFVKKCGLPECLTEGAKKIGWERREELKKADKGTRRRGIGVGCFTNAAGTGGRIRDCAGAFVKIYADGAVQLITGATDPGTGSNTTLAQIVAEELGLQLDDIAVTAGDTDSAPFDSGAFSSRTLYMNGVTVKAAAADAKEQLVEWATQELDVPAELLEVKGGRVYNRLEPEKGMGFKEVARKAADDLTGKGALFLGRASLLNPGHGHSYGAEFAEVEVDTETGQVDVLKIVVEQDVGKAINPMVVEGQIEGAVQQMTGYALSEDIIQDEKTGKMVNADFANYIMLTSADMPTVEVGLVEYADETGPYGAKGMSEGATGGVAPAVANAIYNAVGVRLKELPMTPERVFRALEAKG